ncbi:unnamed protein product [Leuciscus chuanchicus]
MASKQQYRVCVHPCPRYLTGGDTHTLCVVCLGEEHAQSALEGGDCEHCCALPLRTLRSRLARFNPDHVPQGSGPAAAEARRRSQTWGSQMDLSVDVETGSALSQHQSDRSSASHQGAEARAAVSSPLIEAPILQLSSSEELDVVSVEAESEDSPPQSHAFEELLDVITRAVDRLSIEWPEDRQDVRSKSKLDERFLPSRAQPQRRSLPFFPDLHTEVSRSWGKPVSYRVYAPQTSHYSSIQNYKDYGYGEMPKPLVKQQRVCIRCPLYQYRVLPFGLALSPRTFTKCVDAALAPLRLQGIRIMNYIDDWLIIAQSHQLAVQHRDVVLAHMKELGLRLNAKKSVLSPLQRTTFLGVVWDSVSMQARLSPPRIDSILAAVESVKLGQLLTVKQFQRLLGLMAAASNVIPFGLLHMRPLQWWLRTRGFSPRGNPFRTIKVTRRCLRALVMWKKPWFLSQGPVLGAPCRRKLLTTDASLTGWGAILEGRSAQGLWEDHHRSWHINRLEMLAVFRALRSFITDLRGHHVLVHTDNTSVVAYINHQGGLRSRPLSNLARHILLWSQGKLLSLRAAYIPGVQNIGADTLSRQGPRPGEWRLHPEVVELIWREFGQAQVDLFASRETSHCPLWFSLTHPAPLGLDAMGPGPSTSYSPALAGQSMVSRSCVPPRRASSGVTRQEGPSVPGRGLDISPSARTVEPVGLASEGAQLIESGLSTEVVETILQSRAPSTRKLYALKWRVFTSWCSDRRLDPVHCPIGTVLEFLQDRFTAGLTPSTLKVYVAAIGAYHIPLGGMSVGKDPLVSRFLRGTWRLRPAVRSRVPPWDLSFVLQGLFQAPFEPIEEVPEKFLTLKALFLLAISSLKRIGDLQALSVAPSCLEFAPGMVKAFLHPRPGYIPKVPTNVVRPVVLQAFCPPPFQNADQEANNLLCPVRALDAYVHRAALWRKSDQLFVCFGSPNKGGPVSKQRMSKWVVEAISLAYEAAGQPSPMAVRSHSTRSMAASKALISGVSLQDVCDAAGWSSPHTFVRNEEEYDTILTSSSPVVIVNRPPAPTPRPDSLPTPEDKTPFIAQARQRDSISSTYDTFVPSQPPGLDELIKLQEEVKMGTLSIDDALDRFNDWQRLQKGMDSVQQEKIQQLRASIISNREDDESVYAASANECRRASQQLDTEFYSKPLKGQNCLDEPFLPPEMIRLLQPWWHLCRVFACHLLLWERDGLSDPGLILKPRHSFFNYDSVQSSIKEAAPA